MNQYSTGSLNPNSTYIYESSNGTVYRRESGSDPDSRVVVGYTYDKRTHDGRPLHDHITEDKLWGEIRRAAATNPSLKEALERVKVLYYLSKENGG